MPEPSQESRLNAPADPKTASRRRIGDRIHTANVVLALACVIAAGLTGLGGVVSAGLPDWYMHLGMWGVITVYVLLYLNAFYGRRRIRQAVNLLLLLAVSAFWIYVLKELIPAQPMVVGDDLVDRPALPVLWAVVALLGLADLLLLVHALVVGRWRQGRGVR
jgi:hypothetical protein